LRAPSRRAAELNEVRWWSRWARLTWYRHGYLLSSEDLREPFFNRAGTLSCRGVVGTATWAERRLSRRGMGCTTMAFDSCKEVQKLLTSGYRQVDTMTVFLSTSPIKGANIAQEVEMSTDSHRWTATYLRSFYGSEDLAGVISPIVESLLKTRGVTLLESGADGSIAGVLALFRTPAIIGVYCVGTLSEHRNQGVATGLLAKAKQIADSEGRAMILQSLGSEGAGSFYLDKGFEPMYRKLILEKSSNGE
jgi:GNAT superfamily N-acetyltransferase